MKSYVCVKCGAAQRIGRIKRERRGGAVPLAHIACGECGRHELVMLGIKPLSTAEISALREAGVELVEWPLIELSGNEVFDEQREKMCAELANLQFSLKWDKRNINMLSAKCSGTGRAASRARSIVRHSTERLEPTRRRISGLAKEICRMDNNERS